LKELDRRYGDTETIANAFIRKAMEWPQIKADNAKGLDKFAIFLTECENALNSIEAMRILEYSENLRRLVGKLPFHMHVKWRNLVFDTKEKCGTVQFRHLVDLVRKEAHKANDPTYGIFTLSGERIKNVGSSTTKGTKSAETKGSFATVL
jgi:hypothetical protein